LLLAVLGIYSVIAFTVVMRAQEMAIRMALGSERSGIVSLVLSSGLKLAAAGCAIGLAGAFFASRLLKSLVFWRQHARPAGAYPRRLHGPDAGDGRFPAAGTARRGDQPHRGIARRMAPLIP
jgi:ABC-type antimicrobial peptide transport system permease subunit